MYEKKLQDMEDQQKVLENNLLKFLDLKREFSFLQHEAEESDRVVNDFIQVLIQVNITSHKSHQQYIILYIKAVVPNFSTVTREYKSEDIGSTLEDLSSFQGEKNTNFVEKTASPIRFLKCSLICF